MNTHDQQPWRGLGPAVAHALLTDLTIDFTTFRRTTRRPHRIEIWMVAVDDRFFITGTPGARDWYANVVANPACVIHLKQGTPIDLDAVATVVSDPDQRHYLLTHDATTWYRNQGDDLDFLVSDAPLVEICQLTPLAETGP